MNATVLYSAAAGKSLNIAEGGKLVGQAVYNVQCTIQYYCTEYYSTMYIVQHRNGTEVFSTLRLLYI